MRITHRSIDLDERVGTSWCQDWPPDTWPRAFPLPHALVIRATGVNKEGELFLVFGFFTCLMTLL